MFQIIYVMWELDLTAKARDIVARPSISRRIMKIVLLQGYCGYLAAKQADSSE